MTKRIANFIRGMGSALEIAPNPDRQTVQRPLYKARNETAECAIYRSWVRVGNSIIAAAGMNQIDEETPSKA